MASAIGGTIAGFSTIKEGKNMMKAGQAGIDNFEWQDLSNPYANLSASTAGSDLRAEEAARLSSTTVEAARGGGTRGVVGAVGKIQAQNNLVNRDIGADLDAKTKELQMAAAGQDVNNQAIMEKRQEDELAGYGNMVNVGMDLKQQGRGALIAAAGAIDSAAMTAFTGGFGGTKGLLGEIQPPK
jgi:hypothetical protein